MNIGEILAFKNLQYDNNCNLFDNPRHKYDVTESELDGLILKVWNDLGELYKNGIPNRFPQIPQIGDIIRQKINRLVVHKIWRTVIEKDLFKFYSSEQLQEIVNRVCDNDYQKLMNARNISSINVVTDFAVLGLYNMILYLDDSPSMSVCDDIESEFYRWTIQKEVAKTCLFWNRIMSNDGIYVRFYNNEFEGNDIKTMDYLENMCNFRFEGTKSMVEHLKTKVIDDLLVPRICNKMNKLTVVVIFTNKKADNSDPVIETIRDFQNWYYNSPYGRESIKFSFCQIGRSNDTVNWFINLKSNSNIKNNIHFTSGYDFWTDSKGTDKTSE